MSDADRLQAECERGQEQLIATEYLAAAATLAGAEADAWTARDFDTLARLYMPLQETRRQIRLRCGEGAVCRIDGAHSADAVLDLNPQGQLLVIGRDLAGAVRRRAAERRVYVEVLAAEVTPVGMVALPDPTTADGAIPLPADVWPPPTLRGTPATFAAVSALWERLHAPFLAAAEAEPDPVRRMVAFRRTIAVDPACELAHQHLSNTARDLARQLARNGG